MPLLAGPGSIAIIISLSITTQTHTNPQNLLFSILIASIMSFVIWVFGGYLFTQLKGDAVRNLIARLGGLYLLLLAVQMIINGLEESNL